MDSDLAPDTIAGTTCPRCTDEGILTCGVCKNIRYCSQECQHADWSTHKVLCKTFKDFTRRPLAETEMCRIIVFLPGDKKPRFMWVPVVTEDTWKKADLSGLIPEKDDTPLRIEHNYWTEQPLDYIIELHYDDSFIMHYREGNAAVSTATGGTIKQEWRGPIVATCGRILGDDIDEEDDRDADTVVEMIDMDMRIYARLVAFLANYPDSLCQAQEGTKVNCVKVRCSGDQLDGQPSHEAVRIPRSHPIFTGKGTLSMISERLRMPILMMRYPDSQQPKSGRKNLQIASMQTSCDPEGVGEGEDGPVAFGCILSSYGPDDLGTHLVASARMEPLDLQMVKTFGDYCQWHLRAYGIACAEAEARDKASGKFQPKDKGPNKNQQKVLDEIAQEKWSKYQAQWVEEDLDSKDAIDRGDPPYTLEKASSGLERMGLTADDQKRIDSIIGPVNKHAAYIQQYKLMYGEE